MGESAQACARARIFVWSVPASSPFACSVRLDHEERTRKRAARAEGHEKSAKAQNLRGLKAKLFAQERRKEKIRMKKAIKAHEERNVKGAAADKEPTNPVPAYLLDRATPNASKA